MTIKAALHNRENKLSTLSIAPYSPQNFPQNLHNIPSRSFDTDFFTTISFRSKPQKNCPARPHTVLLSTYIFLDKLCHVVVTSRSCVVTCLSQEVLAASSFNQ